MYRVSHSIDPGDIYNQRFGVAGLTIKKAASLCGVTERTWRSYEKGERRIPYSTWCWFVTVTEGIPLDRDWAGWTFRNGKLWSPENDGFSPGEVRAIPLLQQHISALKNRVDANEAIPVEYKQLAFRHELIGQLYSVSRSFAKLALNFDNSNDPCIDQMKETLVESLDSMYEVLVKAAEVRR